MTRRTGRNRLKRLVAHRPTHMAQGEFRRIREELHFSQTELAALLGVGFTAINRKENGRTPITKLEAEAMRRFDVTARRLP